MNSLLTANQIGEFYKKSASSIIAQIKIHNLPKAGIAKLYNKDVTVYDFELFSETMSYDNYYHKKYQAILINKKRSEVACRGFFTTYTWATSTH